MSWFYMTVRKIYLAMILNGLFSVTKSSLRWNIKTRTVIYGDDATLTCNGSGCLPTSIRKWIGGPKYDVLCFDDYSSNPSKYQLVYNKTRPSFDLMIRSFNSTDVNCTYTCACGFSHYTDMLKIDEIKFVYPPNKELTSHIKEIDGNFNVDVRMKVYPLPDCSISYEFILKQNSFTIDCGFQQNISIPIDPEVLGELNEGGLKVHNVRLQYVLNVQHLDCDAYFNMSCKVRSIDYPVLHRRLDLCKDHQDTDGRKYMDVGIIVGFVSSLFVFVLVICYKRKRMIRMRFIERTVINRDEDVYMM